MSQKSTKHSNQLKNLRSKLANAEEEVVRWRRDYYSKRDALGIAEAKVEAYERAEEFTRRILAEQNCNETERLTDIIRWHIKPDTAVIKESPHHPFGDMR